MNDQTMNTDPEIEARKAEIAATRDRLASGVAELEHRVSPENVARAAKEKAKDMAHDAKQAVKDGARDFAEDIGDGVRRGASGFGRAIRDNPVPSALTAMGIGYIVYQAVSKTREGIGGRETLEHETDYGTASRGGSSRAHPLELRIDEEDEDDHGTRGRLRAAGHRAKEGASALADRAREGGKHAAQQARRGGEKVKRETVRAFDERPLIFGLGAFVAGLALGAMIPSTDREDRLMGEQRDRFLREAKSRAQEAAGVAKEAGRKAMDHIDRQLPSGDDRASKDNGSSPGSVVR